MKSKYDMYWWVYFLRLLANFLFSFRWAFEIVLFEIVTMGMFLLDDH